MGHLPDGAESASSYGRIETDAGPVFAVAGQR
jgi:hypothetical protein